MFFTIDDQLTAAQFTVEVQLEHRTSGDLDGRFFVEAFHGAQCESALQDLGCTTECVGSGKYPGSLARFDDRCFRPPFPVVRVADTSGDFARTCGIALQDDGLVGPVTGNQNVAGELK